MNKKNTVLALSLTILLSGCGKTEIQEKCEYMVDYDEWFKIFEFCTYQYGAGDYCDDLAVKRSATGVICPVTKVNDAQ